MPINEWGPEERGFWDDVRETIGIDEDTWEGRALFDVAFTDMELPLDFIENARDSFEIWVQENWDPYFDINTDFPWDDFRDWYEATH